MRKLCYFILLLSIISCSSLKKNEVAHLANKPLFRDPIYDGAADPVIIYNKKNNKWVMFYTNRRAKGEGYDGVTWVHGTRIGIAESNEGAKWNYVDTANINYRNTDYTHWAPEVIENEGIYHMYLTYVPGIFTDWQHPRYILHFTSTDMFDWKFESKLQLAKDKVIDACVFPLPEGGWRMWYNNENDGKSVYYADSKRTASDLNIDALNKDFKLIDNSWWFSVALSNLKERMLDHYLKMKVVVKNYKNNPTVSLNKVKRIVYLKSISCSIGL
jgi:hypothetical protein